MKQSYDKKGISLIILVITIIIMIIIAAAIILTLNGRGIITKSSLAKESSDFAAIKEAVELERHNKLLTGTFDKNKIEIPDIYKEDIQITDDGEILIIYNESTKIIDMANVIKILGATYISNGFDEVQSIAGESGSNGENKLAKIIIEGKSEQAQKTQGKNIIDITKGIPVNCTVSFNSNGGFTVTSTSTKGYLKVPVKIDKTKSYAVSFTSTRTGTTGGGYHSATDNATLITGSADLLNASQYWQINPTTYDITYLYFYANYNGAVGDKTTFNSIQLEQNTVKTTYEPFVPNSPTLEYPSDINSVSNFNLVGSGNNLLFQANKPAQTAEGLTLISNNGVTSLTGQITGSIAMKASGNIKLGYINAWLKGNNVIMRKNTDYTIKITFQGDLNSQHIGLICADESTVVLPNTRNIDSGRTIKVTPTKDIIDMYIIFLTGDTVNATDLKIMINYGSTPLTYEPYNGNEINFPYTLRSLLDGTKDYIEIDNINRNAKLYTNIREINLSDVSTWTFDAPASGSDKSTASFYCSPSGVNSKVGKGCISTHFKPVDVYSNEEGIRNMGTTSLLAFNISKIKLPGWSEELTNQEKIALWVNYISGKDIKALYQIPTTVTDLPYQELQVNYLNSNIYTTSIVKPKIIGQFIN